MEQKISWKYGLFIFLIILILRLPSFSNPASDIATIFLVSLTTYFCFYIANKLYSPRAGLMAALFYAIFTPIYISKFAETSGHVIIISSILLLYFAVRRSVGMITNLFRSGRQKQLKSGECLILIWFLLSLIPASLGGKYFDYYILQLYIPLCILASGGTMHFFKWLNEGGTTRLKQIAYSLFVLGLLIPAILSFGAKLISHQSFKPSFPAISRSF